jgi:O-antigen ligase
VAVAVKPPARGVPGWFAPAVALSLVLSVSAALRLEDGGWRVTLLLLAAAAGGGLLVLLALRRFELFVLAVLVLRASADWFRGARAGGPPPPGPAAAALSLLFLLAAGLWLAARQRARPQMPSPVGLALLALVGACLASVPGSVRPGASLEEAARLLSAAVMFLVLERLVTDRRAVRRVLVACYASAALPLLVGVVHAATGGARLSEGMYRLQATFAHPNAFGYYLALLSVMAVALLPHLRPRLRPALLAFLAVALAQLVLSYSRGGWITLVVGLLVVGVLQSRWLIPALVAAGVLLPLVVPSIGARLADLDDERTLRGTGGNSLVWRVDYWRENLLLVDTRPLTGIGLKMTPYVTTEQTAPHNDYVRMYVETGLLGLTAYLGLLVTLVRAAYHALARAPAGLERGLAVGFAACVTGFAVVSFGSNRITSVVELWYFFALAAAASAAPRILRHD